MIDRRELLRALGAGAATAALAPLGCGRGAARAPSNVEASGDELRRALREAVTVMGGTLEQPRAWVLSRRRVRALVDVAVAEVVEERMMVAVLSGRAADGRRLERCFDEVTATQVGAMAAALAGEGAGTRRTPVAIPAPQDWGEPVEVDPAKLGHGDWVARVRELARRGERAASSRIVYRAAWLATDDDRVWAVGEDGDRHQRLVRSRLGATFVAWQGSLPQFGEAELAGGFGPAVARVSDDEIARAAGDALALFTPTPPPVGRQVVLLDPSVVGAIVDAHARTRRAELPDGPAVKIVEEPAEAGFARYWFDDDGVVGGNARRFPPDWRLAEAPARLAVTAGVASALDLETGINDGLVIEGLRNVHVDDTGMAILRVSRGRQLTNGSRTGRQWGDLEVRGRVAELLSDALSTSRDRREIVVADAPARAVLAPWLLTRASVGRARVPR